MDRDPENPFEPWEPEHHRWDPGDIDAPQAIRDAEGNVVCYAGTPGGADLDCE